MKIRIDAHLDLKSVKRMLAGRGLEEKGRVQRYIDSEVIRLIQPFVPLRTGTLARSPTTGSVIGSGLVIFNTPYAEAQNDRSGGVGSSTGPLRGPRYFDRMKAARGQEIIDGAIKLAGGKP